MLRGEWEIKKMRSMPEKVRLESCAMKSPDPPEAWDEEKAIARTTMLRLQILRSHLGRPDHSH